MADRNEEKGKYGALIQKARQPDNPLKTPTEEPAPPEKQVNLCVKVPESLRRHWAAEAKRQGMTMTEVIVEALTRRFGEPD